MNTVERIKQLIQERENGNVTVQQEIDRLMDSLELPQSQKKQEEQKRFEVNQAMANLG